MISIEDMEIMLDEIASEMPLELFKNLNGGILLLPESKLHQKSIGDDLYILGEYNRGGNLGRFITIYYGSFMQVYGYLSNEMLKTELRKTLKHELRHHIESLAGDKSLEHIDDDNISNYIRRKMQY